MFRGKHRIPNRQRPFLLTPHLYRFCVGFITLTKEMQHTMNDYTAKFNLERHTKLLSILPYSINTNHYVTRNKIGSNIIKSNDIGICVVIEILLVDFKQVLIITE